ncbi:hypothetical protein P691DRAFT_782485 [Macrolepiota fuliginosa MF-IS2]|uniref:Uncharacterized protein n=1 Tax=Macrolepiota fuliginosa MF-IS2 TaxID=1400762 RepID=A0A9P6BWC3_9AGAR|nr:hypothetical protein P691DRAFT_782485 [Macrolepiota fuliginosa MF-IS2]
MKPTHACQRYGLEESLDRITTDPEPVLKNAEIVPESFDGQTSAYVGKKRTLEDRVGWQGAGNRTIQFPSCTGVALVELTYGLNLPKPKIRSRVHELSSPATRTSQNGRRHSRPRGPDHPNLTPTYKSSVGLGYWTVFAVSACVGCAGYTRYLEGRKTEPIEREMFVVDWVSGC